MLKTNSGRSKLWFMVAYIFKPKRLNSTIIYSLSSIFITVVCVPYITRNLNLVRQFSKRLILQCILI